MTDMPSSLGKTLVIATHNRHKLSDFSWLLQNIPMKLLSIKEFTSVDPEETGSSYEENALIKARHAFSLTGHPSLADDSGFEVKALGGAPGIYAARWAKNAEGESDYPALFSRLEKDMGGQDPATDYVCVLAYVDGKREQIFRGVVPGVFDFSKKNGPGFGYCPIFVPRGDLNPKGLSLGEMNDDERRCVSGRGYAAKAFLAHMVEEGWSEDI